MINTGASKLRPIAAAGDFFIGGGANRVLYQDGSSLLATSANFTFTAATGQLALPTTGSGAGILIGGDVQLYRGAADIMYSPDSVIVGGYLCAGNAMAAPGTVPDGAGTFFAPQLASRVSSGAAGVEAFVSDGTNQRRVAVFVDNTNALWGLTYAYSSGGTIPFVIRFTAVEALRLTSAGRLSLPVSGSGAGYSAGGDALWYRDTADLWRTPDSVQIDGTLALGATPSATAKLLLPAGTTGVSPLRFTSGVAPTSPVDGDVWFDGTDLKLRAGGVTYTLTKV